MRFEEDMEEETVETAIFIAPPGHSVFTLRAQVVSDWPKEDNVREISRKYHNMTPLVKRSTL